MSAAARAAIITVAGVSSRFNEGVPEAERVLKAIYTRTSARETLLYQLLRKCAGMDRIIVVGGYQFEALRRFVEKLDRSLLPPVTLVENTHYADLSSGYSLYLGIREALAQGADEVLFVEGDLDIDDDSFRQVTETPGNVLTHNPEPIFANKAVVLYRDGAGRYRYAFNSSHGLLTISEPFSCIYNSGQAWKFADATALGRANEAFLAEDRAGTNLAIIQRYIDSVPQDSIHVVGLKRWTNCNTRADYDAICEFWRDER